jgi:hypothetical protein
MDLFRGILAILLKSGTGTDFFFEVIATKNVIRSWKNLATSLNLTPAFVPQKNNVKFYGIVDGHDLHYS